MNLYIESGARDGLSTVTVSGEVDMSNAPDFLDYVVQHIDGRRDDLHVDLSGIRFMDSSGLGVLIKIHQQLEADGRRLTLRAPSPQVVRTLEVSGLDEFLMVDDTRLEPPPTEKSGG